MTSRSRFTGKRCLVLFDRPPVAAALSNSPGNTLPEIIDAADFINRNQLKLV